MAKRKNYIEIEEIEETEQTPKRKSIAKKVIGYTFILLLVAGLIFTAYIYITTPSISEETFKTPTKASVISVDGVEIGQITARNITYISFDEMPKNLLDAVVALEDRRFYEHGGVDIKGILRALYTNLTAGEIVEGGSTITQQVAKNNFFTTEKSYIRKAREAITALKIENKFSKDDIVARYLNEVYLGGGAYGVYEASQTYFSKEPINLTLAECAMMVGIIQAPSAYCPLEEQGYIYASERKEKALGVMLSEGYITNEEYENAMSEEVEIKRSNKSTFSYGVCLPDCESFMNRVYDNAILLLAQYHKNELNLSEEEANKEAERVLHSRNLTINVPLNYEMQKNAMQSIRDTLSDKSELASCAFVSLDSISGDVLSYYGSDTYIDMAQAPRQPASTIKPLYMAYLLDGGICDASTVVKDEPTEIDGYSPSNFGGEYFGNATMRETLVHSMNCASLNFFNYANMTDIIDYVKGYGISTINEDDYNLAFSLGGLSKGIKPVELAMAYSAVDNGGKSVKANFITSIIDESAKVITDDEQSNERVMKKSTASTLKDYLESVVIRGTGTPASTSYATMGKSGTTDDNKDVWFVGSTANVTTSIWMGNIDMQSVDNLASRWCSSTYKSFIKKNVSDKLLDEDKLTPQREEETTKLQIMIKEKAIEEVTDEDIITLEVASQDEINFGFNQVVKVEIDKESNLLFKEGSCPEENRITRYFFKGSEPTSKCYYWHILDFLRR